ncbi:Hypothetical protein DEACI_3196 [Acididesulfobacillus acetoxydans]|uniref:Uncharacterized protein n=1 Tax=Acididesulfobacillus acetoxydans TaxID=1561005 RepID=A0A8S0XZK0_9FIRM|nr:Hypothetical protein DEACI_3196 [Acididesulfobacillus acetoxydans]CEJ06532.1 Hypothetical protein DEACI_0980 [Acididesulfobacillus acetoxydans]
MNLAPMSLDFPFHRALRAEAGLSWLKCGFWGQVLPPKSAQPWHSRMPLRDNPTAEEELFSALWAELLRSGGLRLNSQHMGKEHGQKISPEI